MKIGLSQARVSLGFPTIEERYFDAKVGANVYVMVGSDGGRVELRQMGSGGIYEAADSSYLQAQEIAGGLVVNTTAGRS